MLLVGDGMKTATEEMAYLLETADQICVVELFTLTLLDGTILRYTSLDIDVTHDGHIFSSDVLITRDKIIQTVGVEVGELQVTITPKSGTINGIPFLDAVRNGALDGATLTTERMFLESWEQL